jgi:hypothetical protein
MRRLFLSVLVAAAGALLPVLSATAEADAKPKTAMAVLTGQRAAPDYVAKNFTLLAGAVVLNQFKIEEIKDPTTMQSFVPRRFKLDEGTTDANFFIEGGFRYRWAWLDRAGIPDPAELDLDRRETLVSAANEGAVAARSALSAATQRGNKEEMVDATKRLYESEMEYTKLKAEVAEEKRQRQAFEALQGKLAQAQSDLAQAERSGEGQEVVQRRQDLAALERSLEASKPDVVREQEQRQSERDLWGGRREQADWAYVFGPRALWGGKKWAVVVPDDWTIRLGYAFPGNTSTTATAIAGASDLYSEVGLGWNLARISLPTDRPEDPPIRGSLSLEVDALMFSDRQLVDVHPHLLLGGSFAFGFPTPLNPGPGQRTSVVEVVVQAGAVLVETPDFLDSQTSELRVRNDVVDSTLKWGFGLTTEINVPITKDLGYVSLRGSLNGGFDPNPWGVTIGYTIPLTTLLDGIGIGK